MKIALIGLLVLCLVATVVLFVKVQQLETKIGQIQLVGSVSGDIGENGTIYFDAVNNRLRTNIGGMWYTIEKRSEP